MTCSHFPNGRSRYWQGKLPVFESMCRAAERGTRTGVRALLFWSQGVRPDAEAVNRTQSTAKCAYPPGRFSGRIVVKAGAGSGQMLPAAVYEKGGSNVKRAVGVVTGAAFLLAAVGGLMLAAAAESAAMKNGNGLFYEIKTVPVTEAFSDIQVEDTECSVRILRAADGNCKVVCPEKQDGSLFHTVTVSDGMLRIRRRGKRKWYQYIGVSLGSPEVEIYLPEREYGALTLCSTAGSIQVDEGFLFESASLESVSSSIRMCSDVKGLLTAESTSGSVTIENAAPETLSAGSISGGIALSHIRSGEVSVRSTSGRMELTDVIAAAGLYAESVSGSVALDGCDGSTIRIETTSGSVKGTLLSDKLFAADSTSGKVEVPRSAAGGECEITTVSGSIAIEIRA